MNAALGGVSAAGIATPESEVTQTGGGPNAFVAIQSGGSAGGVSYRSSRLLSLGANKGYTAAESVSGQRPRRY